MSNALEMLYLNFRKPFDSLQMLAILCKYLTVGHHFRGFPSGSDGKESACNAGDPGSIPGSGRSPGEGNGNLSTLAWKIPWTEKPGRS